MHENAAAHVRHVCCTVQHWACAQQCSPAPLIHGYYAAHTATAHADRRGPCWVSLDGPWHQQSECGGCCEYWYNRNSGKGTATCCAQMGACVHSKVVMAVQGARGHAAPMGIAPGGLGCWATATWHAYVCVLGGGGCKPLPVYLQMKSCYVPTSVQGTSRLWGHQAGQQLCTPATAFTPRRAQVRCRGRRQLQAHYICIMLIWYWYKNSNEPPAPGRAMPCPSILPAALGCATRTASTAPQSCRHMPSSCCHSIAARSSGAAHHQEPGAALSDCFSDYWPMTPRAAATFAIHLFITTWAIPLPCPRLLCAALAAR